MNSYDEGFNLKLSIADMPLAYLGIIRGQKVGFGFPEFARKMFICWNMFWRFQKKGVYLHTISIGDCIMCAMLQLTVMSI